MLDVSSSGVFFFSFPAKRKECSKWGGHILQLYVVAAGFSKLVVRSSELKGCSFSINIITYHRVSILSFVQLRSLTAS